MRYLPLLIIIHCGCETQTTPKSVPKDLDQLVTLYNPKEEFLKARNNEVYNIGNKLDSLMSRLDVNEIIPDTNFRKPLLLLLEKKYLFIAEMATDVRLSHVNNAFKWGRNGRFTQFALNIYSKIPSSKNQSYDKYVSKIKDVVCINNIVAEMSTYTLGDTSQREIHDNCKKKLPDRCVE